MASVPPPPPGYTRVVTEGVVHNEVQREHFQDEPAEQPAGYKKARALKHDENNRRPPRQAGRPNVCQCCYRARRDIFDYVCKRCLKDRHEVALLEQEIARVIPATANMTMPQIFKRLWERSLKLEAANKALKAKVEKMKARRIEDDADLIGRVGHR